MIESGFKKDLFLHLKMDGSNFTVMMLSGFNEWKFIDKEDIIELLSFIKYNELSLYYVLQFFHLYLGVKIEPLYKELNEQLWKEEKCRKAHEGFAKISYLFSRLSFSRLKKYRISRSQLLNIRSRLIEQGLEPVRHLSIELPRK